MNAKQNLLIVDENPYVAGVLVQTLRTDFNVTVAGSGQDAARLLMQENRFDCILTELNLPDFGGLELTRLIRTNRAMSHTPVVVLSGATDSNTRIQCLEQGVDGYITKPFNPFEVQARLRAILRRISVPAEAVQPRPQPVRSAPADQRNHPFKARFLSIFYRDFSLSQSA